MKKYNEHALTDKLSDKSIYMILILIRNDESLILIVNFDSETYHVPNIAEHLMIETNIAKS